MIHHLLSSDNQHLSMHQRILFHHQSHHTLQLLSHVVPPISEQFQEDTSLAAITLPIILVLSTTSTQLLSATAKSTQTHAVPSNQPLWRVMPCLCLFKHHPPLEDSIGSSSIFPQTKKVRHNHSFLSVPLPLSKLLLIVAAKTYLARLALAHICIFPLTYHMQPGQLWASTH